MEGNDLRTLRTTSEAPRKLHCKILCQEGHCSLAAMNYGTAAHEAYHVCASALFSWSRNLPSTVDDALCYSP
jgi:hypothetical protein